MKILDDIEDLPASPATSYAGLLEKIEILRSTLRWSSRMERPEIEKLLRQASVLRDEVMQLSHRERFVQAAVAEPQRLPGCFGPRGCDRGILGHELPTVRKIFDDGRHPRLPFPTRQGSTRRLAARFRTDRQMMQTSRRAGRVRARDHSPSSDIGSGTHTFHGAAGVISAKRLPV